MLPDSGYKLWKFSSSCSFERDQETGFLIDPEESCLQPSIHEGDQTVSQYQGCAGRAEITKLDIYPTSNVTFSHEIEESTPLYQKNSPKAS